MDNFIDRHKGPLIAVGSAAIGLLLLLIISALANMPEDISFINIFTNLIWLILIGGLAVGVFLYLRERFDYEYDEQDLYDQMPLVRAGIASQIVPAEHNLIKEQVVKLFGTADMQQVTKAVEVMYGELQELRERSDQPSQQKGLITALTSERDQAQAACEKWEVKATSRSKEVQQLRQEIKEHGKWEVVPEEELATFFPTVNLGDGEEPFLSSSRRQRRLMQRLSAEGYSILKRKVN